jgi:hypothetical protein
LPRRSKKKLSPAQFGWRFAREKARQERRYCDAFGLWRDCPRKSCRRHRACGGDPHLCLKRAAKEVSHQEQSRTREDMLRRTGGHIGGPERAARQCMPYDFQAEPVERVVAEYQATRRRQRMMKGF